MPNQRHLNTGKAAVSSLVILGLMTLIISIRYASSFLALLGFALVFWSAILLYLTPSKPVLLQLLSATGEPGIANIERILDENNLYQQGIYLSGKIINEQNHNSCLLFIPKDQNYTLQKDFSSFKRNNFGVYITPPGEAICKLFEKHAKISFNETSLDELKSILPKILSTDLAFVEAIDIQDTQSTITIEITRNIFEGICDETNTYPRTHKQVGCLLTSALACVLAKALGKPLVFEKEARDLQQGITQIQYRIITGELKEN